VKYAGITSFVQIHLELVICCITGNTFKIIFRKPNDRCYGIADFKSPMMTKKITSFFQVSKKSKIGTSNRSDAKRGRDEDTENNDLAAFPDETTVTNTSGDAIDNTLFNNKKSRSSSEVCTFQGSDYVRDLLSSLHDDTQDHTNPEQAIYGWKHALQKHCETTSFQNLANFVALERQRHTIYPPPTFVWSALNQCPLQNVKVVIVGQDPYHGYDQAHGLSFSVKPGCPIPPSLKNMYDMILNPSVRFPFLSLSLIFSRPINCLAIDTFIEY
jgi:hypothetical protein